MRRTSFSIGGKLMNTPFVLSLAVSTYGGLLYVPVDAGMWNRAMPVAAAQTIGGRPFDTEWFDSLLGNSSKPRGPIAAGGVGQWGLLNSGTPWTRPGQGVPQSSGGPNDTADSDPVLASNPPAPPLPSPAP